MTETPDPNWMPGSSPTPADPPPHPMGYSAPAKPRQSRGTGLMMLGVLAMAVVGIAACDSLPGAVDSLQIGDCIDEPAEDATITEVQHRPCTQPHDGEVFAVLTNPAGSDEPYPVVSGFDDYIQTNCIPLWEAYTGRSWATDTEIDLNYLRPTLSGWADGDRGFTCYLTRLDGEKLSASVKGIGASPLP